MLLLACDIQIYLARSGISVDKDRMIRDKITNCLRRYFKHHSETIIKAASVLIMFSLQKYMIVLGKYRK